MKLTVIERVMLPLPEKTNIKGGILKREIAEKIKVTADELKSISFSESENGIVIWDQKANDKSISDFDLTSDEIQFLKKEVEKMDAEESIPDHLFEYCRRVMEK